MKEKSRLFLMTKLWNIFLRAVKEQPVFIVGGIMKFMCIASGSSGNCIYIGSEGTNLLLDAGVSCKNIVSGLKSINVNPESIDAILVTHEHIDHIRGIDVFEKNYKAKVYSTNETLESIKGKYISRDIFMPVTPGREFNIGSIEITHFQAHDAANPVCYTFLKQEAAK